MEQCGICADFIPNNDGYEVSAKRVDNEEMYFVACMACYAGMLRYFTAVLQERSIT